MWSRSKKEICVKMFIDERLMNQFNIFLLNINIIFLLIIVLNRADAFDSTELFLSQEILKVCNHQADVHVLKVGQGKSVIITMQPVAIGAIQEMIGVMYLMTNPVRQK